jgi:hypothetical protein
MNITMQGYGYHESCYEFSVTSSCTLVNYYQNIYVFEFNYVLFIRFYIIFKSMIKFLRAFVRIMLRENCLVLNLYLSKC